MRSRSSRIALALLGLGAVSFASTLWMKGVRTSHRGDAAPAMATAPPATTDARPPAAEPAAPVELEPAQPAAAPAPERRADPLQGEELERVVADLGSTDRDVRSRALNELRRAEADIAVPLLGRALEQDPDLRIQLSAIDLLGRLRRDPRWHEAADNALRSRLDDGDEFVVSRIREYLDRSPPVAR